MEALIERIKRAQQARDNNKESTTPSAAPRQGSPRAEFLPPTNPKPAQYRRRSRGRAHAPAVQAGPHTTPTRRLVGKAALLPELAFACLGEMLTLLGRPIR